MTETPKIENIESAIHVIRGHRVMLDSDLAGFYGVVTKVLNQAVRRNAHRFPDDFAFQLDSEEVAFLRSQIVTSNGGRGGRRYLPWVFTEHGAVMLASVLNSAVAISASVAIVRTFVRMRNVLADSDLVAKLVDIEKRLAGHDSDLATVFSAIQQLIESPEGPKKEMGFHTLMEETEGRTASTNLPHKPVTYERPRQARKEKK